MRGRSRLLSSPVACRLLPEQTKGPYHRPVHPERSDITENRLGVALHLGVRLLHADGRTPLRGGVTGHPHLDS